MLMNFVGEEGADPRSYPVKVGSTCDVAEIYEMPAHVMFREPGEQRWPAPGEPGFGWHPELFEPRGQLIEIVSCGYELVELYDWFGVLISNRGHIQRLLSYREAMQSTTAFVDGSMRTDWSQEANQWRAKLGPVFGPEFMQTLGELEEWRLGPPDVVRYDQIFYTTDELTDPFALVGYWCDLLVRADARASEAAPRIERFLAALQIPCEKPALRNEAFFRGDGGPRIINPPLWTITTWRKGKRHMTNLRYHET